VEPEAARDLVRAREDVRDDLMRATHQVSKPPEVHAWKPWLERVTRLLPLGSKRSNLVTTLKRWTGFSKLRMPAGSESWFWIATQTGRGSASESSARRWPPPGSSWSTSTALSAEAVRRRQGGSGRARSKCLYRNRHRVSINVQSEAEAVSHRQQGDRLPDHGRSSQDQPGR
jgi:hypothetical protein